MCVTRACRARKALPKAGTDVFNGVIHLNRCEKLMSMEFRTRKFVKPPDLNPHGTLFGGRVLEWIDEEAAIFAACQVGSSSLVTKLMSEVNFVSSARNGDIIEIGCETLNFGRTSIAVRCQVRNKETEALITEVDKIVFVHVDQNGKPTPHPAFEKKA
jgi:acyl-CoA thioesterase YciA